MQHEIFDYTDLGADRKTEMRRDRNRFIASAAIIALVMFCMAIAKPLIFAWVCLVSGVLLMYLVPDLATLKTLRLKALALAVAILMSGTSLVTTGVVTGIYYINVDGQESPADHFHLFRK